jgi:hypothetical protein
MKYFIHELYKLANINQCARLFCKRNFKLITSFINKFGFKFDSNVTLYNHPIRRWKIILQKLLIVPYFKLKLE